VAILSGRPIPIHRRQSGFSTVFDSTRHWQQVNWRVGELLGGTLSARARLEQRSVSIGDDIGQVARVMLKFVRPFSGASGSYWIASLEPFVSLSDTDWGVEKGLGQNRFAVGIGRPVGEHLVIEAGYMNQYIFRDTAEDISNHLAVIHFKMKF